MKNADEISLRSEFRSGAADIFKREKERRPEHSLTDPEIVREAAKAAFYDIPDIEKI